MFVSPKLPQPSTRQVNRVHGGVVLAWLACLPVPAPFLVHDAELLSSVEQGRFLGNPRVEHDVELGGPVRGRDFILRNFHPVKTRSTQWSLTHSAHETAGVSIVRVPQWRATYLTRIPFSEELESRIVSLRLISMRTEE